MAGQRGVRPNSIRIHGLPAMPADDFAPASVRVVYTCPHCTHPLRIRPEYFGSSLACKHCNRPFIPSLAQVVSNQPTRSLRP